MDIDKIITESINKIVKEAQGIQVNVGNNGWHSWADTDAANGLTPEEGKAMRMQPGNAARANGTAQGARSFDRPTYEEWKAKYPNMKYSEYCYKIYGVKLR